MMQGYASSGFTTGNQVGLNDFFVGTGSQTAFVETNKNYIDTGSVVQAGATQYNRFNGGVTGSGSTVNLSTPPANGIIITVPAIICFQFAAYGQATVEGIGGSPNVSQTAGYFADITEIGTNSYLPTIGQSNILIQAVNHDLTNGPALATWLQFAPMLADGSAGSYGSAGVQLSEPAVQAADTLQSGVSALATMLTVADGSQFTGGRFIILDFGLSNQDIVQVTNIATNILTTTPTTYSHLSTATVLEIGFGFYCQLTLPTSFVITSNFYNVCLEMLVDQVSR